MKSLLLFVILLAVAGYPGRVLAQEASLILRQGHTKAINEVIYSPDGKFIYSASDDQSIKMWDVMSGVDLRSFNGHPAAVLSLALTKDGQTLLSGDASGTIIIWDVEEPTKPIKIIEAHEGPIFTIELYDDEVTFLTGGQDKLIKRWNLQEGTLIKTIEAMSSEVKAIGLHPNQKTAVVGGQKTNDLELLILDMENGTVTDDILNYYKNSGLAKVYTYAVLSGFSAALNIAKGNVGKDMLDFYTIDFTNIEFKKDGSSVLVSQSLYLPLAAAKGEEEQTGSTTISIADISEDGTKFINPKQPKRWSIGYSNAKGVFNQDQTKIILNKKFSINIYDMETAEFPDGSNKDVMGYEPPLIKELKGGSVAWLNSIAMSPDYRSAASSDDQQSIKLWDMETGRIYRNLEGFVQPALAIDVMPDGKHIVVGSEGRDMTMWDITTGRLVRTFDRSGDVNFIDASKDGKYLVTTAQNTSFFKVWNVSSGRLLKSVLENDKVFTWVKFLDDPNEIYAKYESADDAGIGMSMLKSDDEVRIYNRQDGKSKKVKDGTVESLEDKYDLKDQKVSWDGYTVQLQKGGQIVMEDTQAGLITDASFSLDGKYLITTNRKGEIILYDMQLREKAISMALIGNFDYVTYTPDFYYTSSKNAAKAIAFKSGNIVLPFEQLELKYNRPDIVAERLGYASSKLVASYKAAYDRRLQRLGLKQDALEGRLQLPEVSLNYEEIPLAVEKKQFTFSLSANDEVSGLSKLHVYVNDVPLYGAAGNDISSPAGVTQQHAVNLDLSAGLNEVKVVAMSRNGLESFPQSFEIRYNSDFQRPNLYLVSIGVSEYQQSDYNLAFAAKDATDIASTLSGSSSYENIYTKVLTNQDATKSNILGLRSFLQQAGVDDVVVIFIAGHGVLDKSYNYYFATHNMDFNNPVDGGLPYASIEDLIDGIACRNKALFLDTCHSGELDKDDVTSTNEKVIQRGSVAFRSTGKLVKLKESSFGLENTLELSKTLFSDLKKGTGATVISAAGGTEFALEGLNSDNGLFTSCLIEGIQSRRIDTDRNRSYTVSEFQRYISEQVIERSNGDQVPTSREENLKNDFRVY